MTVLPSAISNNGLPITQRRKAAGLGNGTRENSPWEQDQGFVDLVYARLDDLRDRYRDRLAQVRREGPAGSPQNRSERDAFATHYEDTLARLDQVENRLVTLAPGLPQSALVEAGNFLNARIRGKTLAEAKEELEASAATVRAELDELTQRVVAAGLASWSGGDPAERKLIVRGQAKLLEEFLKKAAPDTQYKYVALDRAGKDFTPAVLPLELGDAVTVEGFGLSGRLAGGMEIVEVPSEPATGSGELRVEEGTYEAYGQELEVRTGRGVVGDRLQELLDVGHGHLRRR